MGDDARVLACLEDQVEFAGRGRQDHRLGAVGDGMDASRVLGEVVQVVRVLERVLGGLFYVLHQIFVVGDGCHVPPEQLVLEHVRVDDHVPAPGRRQRRALAPLEELGAEQGLDIEQSEHLPLSARQAVAEPSLLGSAREHALEHAREAAVRVDVAVDLEQVLEQGHHVLPDRHGAHVRVENLDGHNPQEPRAVVHRGHLAVALDRDRGEQHAVDQVRQAGVGRQQVVHEVLAGLRRFAQVIDHLEALLVDLRPGGGGREAGHNVEDLPEGRVRVAGVLEGHVVDARADLEPTDIFAKVGRDARLERVEDDVERDLGALVLVLLAVGPGGRVGPLEDRAVPLLEVALDALSVLVED